MATTTNNVVLTLAFLDSTSRNVTFTGVDAMDLLDVGDNVKTINANMPQNFSRTFVSATGAQCTMISKAKIVSITEDVIYNAS